MTETIFNEIKSPETLKTVLMYLLFFVAAIIVLAMKAYMNRKNGDRWSPWWSSEFDIRLGELQAAPVDMLDIPDEVKNYFRDNHPLIQELGFEMVGDYRVVHGATPIYARYYWHPDVGTFTEVAFCQTGMSSLIESANARSVTFISVFEDGSCIQTSNDKSPGTPLNNPDQLMLQYRPFRTPAELLNEHRATIDEYVVEADSQMLHYPAEQLANVSEYYAQMQRERWVEDGTIKPPLGYDETASRLGFSHETESTDT